MPPETARQTEPATAVVVGTGLIGALTAALLAADGVPTTIVETEPAWRLPAGPVTPETAGLLRAIGRRHGVPEVEALASARGYAAAGGAASPQRAIGFVYHGTGRQHPRQTNTFVPPKVLDAPPYLTHDDAARFLLAVAVARGATVASAQQAEQASATLVVDTVGTAAGGPSVEHVAIAEFARLTPYDATSAAALHDGPVPWRATALHHLTAGALVVTGPTTGGAAVPVTLRWRGDDEPGARFAALLDERPDIAAAFTAAEQVTPWSVVQAVAAAAPHGAARRVRLPEPLGATDAFDRQLPTALLAASTLASGVRGGSARDVPELLSAGQALDERWRAALDVALLDYRTWNAAFRVWAVGQVHGTVWAEDIRRRAAWDELTTGAHPGSPIPESADYARLTDNLFAALDDVDAGRRTPDEAADAVFADLATAPVVPPTFGLADPEHRHYVPSPPRMIRALRWARTPAAEEVVAARIAPTVRSLVRERVAGRFRRG